MPAAGFEIGQDRDTLAHPREIVEGKFHPGGVGDRQKVQHGIGRTAEGDHDGNGVLERLPREDVERPQSSPEHLHDRGAGAAAVLDLGFGLAPARRQSSTLALDMAFWAELLGRLMPNASIADAIVLAVYMPPQDPGPGMAHCSMACNSSSPIFRLACAPMASKTETMSNLRESPVMQPGRMVPP